MGRWRRPRWESGGGGGGGDVRRARVETAVELEGEGGWGFPRKDGGAVRCGAAAVAWCGGGGRWCGCGCGRGRRDARRVPKAKAPRVYDRPKIRVKRGVGVGVVKYDARSRERGVWTGMECTRYYHSYDKYYGHQA